MATQETQASSGLATGLKVVAGTAVLGVLVQAWLGSSGFFQGVPGRIEVHEMLANLFFLLMVGQVAMAFFAMQKGLASRTVLYLSLLGLGLTVAQIGLGYSTRNVENAATALSWHLSVGVLLMGTTAMVAALVWNGSESTASAK